MGIMDRDWYREDYNERQAKYGKNTGNGSSRKKERESCKASSHKGMLSEGFINAARTSETEREKALYAVAGSFFGALLSLFLYSKLRYTFPITLMILYDFWMIIYVFTKRPKTSVGTRILAIFFFFISEGMLSLMLYLIYWR